MERDSQENLPIIIHNTTHATLSTASITDTHAVTLPCIHFHRALAWVSHVHAVQASSVHVPAPWPVPVPVCSSRGPCTHRRQAHQGCMVPVGWKLRTRVFGTSTILKLLVLEAVWCTAAVVTVLVDTCEKCVSFWECWCTLKAFRLRVARVIGGPADLPYSGKLNKLNLFSLLNKITISPLLKYL